MLAAWLSKQAGRKLKEGHQSGSDSPASNGSSAGITLRATATFDVLMHLQACGGPGTPTFGNADGSSQQQHWSIGPVPGVSDQFYIAARGRNGNCPALLGAASCSSASNTLTCNGEDDGEPLSQNVSSDDLSAFDASARNLRPSHDSQATYQTHPGT